MSKRKKMLLISLLIGLSSCMKGVPEAPEAKRIVPIWRNTSSDPQIKYFHGQFVKSQEKFDWSNAEAYQAGLVCSDLETYNAEAAYMEAMKRLAKERCK